MSVPTIRDVARLAGVSVATVSRYLNHKGYVSRETAEKVEAAIRALKFEPNEVARGLANQKLNAIAVILPDITNPFFPELLKAIDEQAERYGYNVLVWNARSHASKRSSYARMIRQQYLDGAIIAAHDIAEDEIARLQAEAIPLVLVDRPSAHGVPQIRSRNREGARLAVRHLMAIGAEQIAHLSGPASILPAAERRQGYLDEVEARPWFAPSLIVGGELSIEGGMAATEALLARHPDVDAIFAANDLMAIGALKVLHRRGIRVPEDVALIGFDDIPLAAVVEPELSTVRQPVDVMGRLAVDLLLRRSNARPKKKHPAAQPIERPDDPSSAAGPSVYELEVTVIERASTLRKNR